MRVLPLIPARSSITPDKKSLYLTIDLAEGERYKVSRTVVTGEMATHGQEIEALAQPLSGRWYSGAEITAVENAIKKRFGKIWLCLAAGGDARRH
ncbi:Omp85 [Raoultella terrigena]|uniref:Omp85 n=1 Tax=Raoultella terrigena TaxID=577 RepID=A0A485AV55_RAOTE|nr:Omp85 [Raoultella terrigena]